MENTFAAQVRPRYLPLMENYLKGDPEFLRLGVNIFESEELTEHLYRIFLALIADHGWRGDQRKSIDDIGAAYMDGFYLPCVERVVLSGQVDLRNDSLPDYAGLVSLRGQNADAGLTFFSARKAPAPRRVRAPPFGQVYAFTQLWRDRKDEEDNGRTGRRLGKLDMRLFTEYVSVMPSGAITPCIPSDNMAGAGQSDAIGVFGIICQSAAATLNANADARHLWQVRTGENVTSAGIQTPLSLGVSEEHVKSLFYARQAPLTASGRKASILHWVRAHQRRMKAGIDIDVRRHLRGIERFEMDGLNFEIVNPSKPNPRS